MIIGCDYLYDTIPNSDELDTLSRNPEIFKHFSTASQKLILEVKEKGMDEKYKIVKCKDCEIRVITLSDRKYQNCVSHLMAELEPPTKKPIVLAFIILTGIGVSYRFLHNENFSLSRLTIGRLCRGHPQASGGKFEDFIRVFYRSLGENWLVHHIQQRRDSGRDEIAYFLETLYY